MIDYRLRMLLQILALGLLAACGADGAPTAPAAKPGLTISGQAKVGVAGS
jgi:hypothetical protein